MKRRKQWGVVLGMGLVATGSAPAEDRDTTTLEYSTPPGITLIEVARRYVYLPLTVEWIGLGDAEGRTLFISDRDQVPGSSHCTETCADTFPPALAERESKPAGEWSLIEREGGVKQWAYKGKPLYRFANETRINEVADTLLALDTDVVRVTDNGFTKSDAAGLLPPEGWQVARFDPLANEEMPGVVSVRDLPAASGMGFVSSAGMILYRLTDKATDVTTNCDNCDYQWEPLVASELSNPVGSFSPVQHDDGSRQWAYKGDLLFTYGGDFVPGDINGVRHADDGRWQIALLAQHFMPAEVIVRHDPVFGAILSSSQGLPLYSRYSVERFYNDSRVEDDSLYVNGKKLGVKGCDAECLRIWRPVMAPDDAKAQGFWEPIDRGDDTRQWAYKGFVQFTNANDKPHDIVTANNQFVYVVGDNGRYPITDTFPVNNRSVRIPGFHWRVSDLHPRSELGMGKSTTVGAGSTAGK